MSHGKGGPAQDTPDLLPYGKRLGASPGVAEELAAGGPQGRWPGPDASTVAVAGRDAVVQTSGQGLWEIRTNLPSSRISRVFLGMDDGNLVALHAFIKKTQKTPDSELAIARKRLKELTS